MLRILLDVNTTFKVVLRPDRQRFGWLGPRDTEILRTFDSFAVDPDLLAVGRGARTLFRSRNLVGLCSLVLPANNFTSSIYMRHSSLLPGPENEGISQLVRSLNSLRIPLQEIFDLRSFSPPLQITAT